MADGFWNGLPTTIQQVTGVVPEHDPEIHPPLAWWKELSGQRIEAVRVVLDGVNYGGGVTYLDNRDGSGWRKVTEGHGSPRWPHRNVPLIDVRSAQGQA